MFHKKKNNVIFTALISLILDNKDTKNITIIEKIKETIC